MGTSWVPFVTEQVDCQRASPNFLRGVFAGRQPRRGGLGAFKPPDVLILRYMAHEEPIDAQGAH